MQAHHDGPLADGGIRKGHDAVVDRKDAVARVPHEIANLQLEKAPTVGVHAVRPSWQSEHTAPIAGAVFVRTGCPPPPAPEGDSTELVAPSRVCRWPQA